MTAPPTRTAFLLSQLGSLASSHFAQLTRELGLTPSDAGVLRIVARTPTISQRNLAERLGITPSRVVALVDSLELRNLLVRSRSTTDRRNIELQLTETGQNVMRELRTVAQEQEASVLTGLNDDERAALNALLSKLATAHGLDHNVHPGYRA